MREIEDSKGCKKWTVSLLDLKLVKPFKLVKDLDCHWTKRDKSNPFKEPLQDVYCTSCEAVVGGFDVETGDFTWYENCACHTETKTETGTIVESYCCNSRAE